MFSQVNREPVLDSMRTAVAAVAAMLLARLLHMPEFYWAPISAIVIVQSTIPPMTLGWQRFVGTALGAVVGMCWLRFSIRAPSCTVGEFWLAEYWAMGAASGRSVPVCSDHAQYYLAGAAGASSMDHWMASVSGGFAGHLCPRW